MLRFSMYLRYIKKGHMKKFLLFILHLLVLASCAKQDSNIQHGLIGKWKAVEHFYSIGGPLIYTPENGTKILQLNADGSVEGNYFNVPCASNQNCVTREVYKFSIIDSLKIRFYDRTRPDQEDIFVYQIKGNTLTLGYIGCIEGCGTKFTAVE